MSDTDFDRLAAAHHFADLRFHARVWRTIGLGAEVTVEFCAADFCVTVEVAS